MSNNASNIVWHKSEVIKIDRHSLNNHKSGVIWFTGLSGAGKSTLANELERQLHSLNVRSYVLDGDNIRHGLNQNLGFSPDDRKENIRRIGEVAKLFVDAGMFALTAFISPYKEDRELVRALLGEGEFIEVFVKCSIEECERRDPKGLYQKARKGEIKEFTGVSAPYEEPELPEILIDSERMSVTKAATNIINYLRNKGLLYDSENK